MDWTAHIKEYEQFEKKKWVGCQKLLEAELKVKLWTDLAWVSVHRPPVRFPESIFSSFTECDDKLSFIEPLVGHLRDPRWWCGAHTWYEPDGRHVERPNPMNRDARFVTDHRNLLLQQRIDWIILPWPAPGKRLGERVFWFDIGAKDWNAGSSKDINGQMRSSMKWAWEEMKKRNHTIDYIYAWDFDVDFKEMWQQYPSEVLPHVVYGGYKVSPEAGAARNPFTFMRMHCRPEDYVMVKLDIDAPQVEFQLVQQLLREEPLWDLIDEFFWEHHTLGNPMSTNRVGWKHQIDDLKDQDKYLHDSYEYFTRLRTKGIRAHSWV